MVCLLSRASRSLERGYPSAEHEAMMTQIFCDEVIFCFIIGTKALTRRAKVKRFDVSC